jgi:DNA-binding NarL/FixJ family response regulator
MESIEPCVEMANNIKPKLLIAEDHPAMRAMVTSLLQRDFDVVAIVVNGEAAVQAANNVLPDILILDVSMPILNGTEAARRLKLQGCKAKIIFLSVSSDVDQVTACFAAGGAAYVLKARMDIDLVFAITEVLAGREFVSPEASRSY